MNTNHIANFEKVSYEEYLVDRLKFIGLTMDTATDKKKTEIFEEWQNIKLPARSTAGAAGYDFYSPMKIVVSGHRSEMVPTGIRVKMDEGWVMMLFPRSGLGTKYGVGLDNTVGIIDSDYYYADNEGHIMAKLHTDETVMLNEGDRFIQGIFLPFGTSYNGNTEETRTGGFGSTGTK